MKRFVTILTLITLILGLFISLSSTSSANYSIILDEVIYTYDNLDELDVALQGWRDKNKAAKNMKEAALVLGYSADHDIIKTAEFEILRTNDKVTLYEQSKNIIIKKHMEKYPHAAYIWNFLKSKGYNDYVAAGILGNMMVEVGGGTLKLQPDAYGKGYYGICQWSKGYKEVWGKPLEYQCNFLEDTIRYELNTFGKAYQQGFNYDKFVQLQDERAAALAFAKCYERCSAKGYAKRQNCAEIAYDYFT